MSYMTSTEDRRTHARDARQYTASIARWENEGGAARSRPSPTGAKRVNKHRPSRRMIANKREGFKWH
jgi:hypothetical protein